MKKTIIFAFGIMMMISMNCLAELVTIPIFLRTTGNDVTFYYCEYHNVTRMNIVKSDGTIVCDLLQSLRWGYLYNAGYGSLELGDSITIDTDETYYLDFYQGEEFRIHFSGGGGHITHGFGVYFGSPREHRAFDLAAFYMRMYQNGTEITQIPVLLEPDASIWTNRDLKITENEDIIYYPTSGGGAFCASSTDLDYPGCIALYIDLGYDTYYYQNI